MELNEQGQYIISWKGEKCIVEVEDTAFFIQRVDKENNGFLLYLNDDTKEYLNPKTLYIGKNNILYCKVKNGRFPAKFTRSAYYQIAEYIEEENSRYFLIVNDKKYFLNYV